MKNLRNNSYKTFRLLGYISFILFFSWSCLPSPEPVASFNAQPRIIELGDTIYFTNKSASFQKVLWNFGDNSFSEENNPFHIYQTPGDFSPSITAIYRKKTNTNTLKITVIAPEYTVHVNAISETKFHLECNTSLPVEWFQNNRPFSEEAAVDKEFDRSDSLRIAVVIKGTRYILWDTTLMAINQPTPVTKTETTPAENGKPTETEVPVITEISVNPLNAEVNQNIHYSCNSNVDITWDFNGESSSALKMGNFKFTSSGIKVIVLREKETGKEVKKYTVKVGVTEEMGRFSNIHVSPLKAFVDNQISFSCITNSEVIWNFNGEFTSENKIGTMSFKTPGKKKVELKDKKSGRVVKSFTIDIEKRISAEEFAGMLNKLANENTSRKDKNNLEKELYSKCSHGPDTKISGKAEGTIQDFVYEIGIQSNEYIKVELQVSLVYNSTGSIDEIVLTDYKKTDIE
jgi:hypothetical protein